jgi:hypothetical protein
MANHFGMQSEAQFIAEAIVAKAPYNNRSKGVPSSLLMATGNFH